MSALEDRLATMEKAFNINTKAFSDGMQMLEAQDAVFRRVIQDLIGGSGLRLMQEDLNRIVAGENDVRIRIDFNAYLKDYIAELVLHEEQVATQAPVIVIPDEDQPRIFGGN